MTYLEPDTFKRHVTESYEKQEITNDLAKDLMLMCDHILVSRRFYNYDEELKKDMKQAGLYKAVKYFKGFNPAKCKNPFNYFTRIFMTTFLTEYTRWQRFYDKRNLMTKLYMDEYKTLFPNMKFETNYEILED